MLISKEKMEKLPIEGANEETWKCQFYSTLEINKHSKDTKLLQS